MQQQEIMDRLQQVFDGAFLEKVTVHRDLSAKDVEEWDSLAHVSLILAIEQAFGIRFRLGEVEGTKNLGELADLIAKHLNKG
jgi:acyl carrier protein